MTNQTKPFYIDTVTHIPAFWANAVSDLVYDVFGLAATKAGARAALELGTIAIQDADAVQIAGGSINNVPIGLSVPMQGRFTVLSITVDPIDPEHGVNKRYLNQRLFDFSAQYLPLIGGTLTGPLTLYGDPQGPLEAVPRRWVDFRILDTIQNKPVQRLNLVSRPGGQSVFEWPTFNRPARVYAENFLVYIDGQFQTLSRHYTVDLTEHPIFDFGTPVAELREFDVVYVNNLENLLEQSPPVVTPPDSFVAGPGWSNPINMRINYAIPNAGENRISISHTVLRQMYFGCVITQGALQDRVISWNTSWLPGSPAAQTHQPSLVVVSATEARLDLPEGLDDTYWEGHLSITMFVDGVPAGHKLWMNMTNEVTPDYRDGIVRWGTTAPVVVDPDVNIVTVYGGPGNPGTYIPDGGTTPFQNLRLTVEANNVPVGAVIELYDGATLLGLVPDNLVFNIPAAEYGNHEYIARVVSPQNAILATSSVYIVNVDLPTPVVSGVIDNFNN